MKESYSRPALRLTFLSILTILTTFAVGADPTVVRFATWFGRGDAASTDDYITLFEKKYPDIRIEYQSIAEGNYSEKINAMVAAGTAPDVILAWETDISRFAKAKVIDSLDPYLKATKAFSTDDLIPAVKQMAVQTGATYGLPWCAAAEIAYYNRDMFIKAGVPLPKDDWTWADFEAAAKKLTIVQNGKTTQWGADITSFQGLWYSLIGASGDNIIDAKGNLVLGAGAKKTLTWLNDLANKSKVIPRPSTGGTNTIDLFATGRAAISFNGNWWINTYRTTITDFHWDIAPLPKGVRQYTSLHTGLYTINAKSKVKDAAWKFIEFAMSDEGQASINKVSANPSARKSMTERGYYRAGGDMGPTNWAAIDKSMTFGQFGYVMANSGVTNAAVSDFQAVLLGQKTVDAAIKDANANSAKIAAN